MKDPKVRDTREINSVIENIFKEDNIFGFQKVPQMLVNYNQEMRLFLIFKKYCSCIDVVLFAIPEMK